MRHDSLPLLKGEFLVVEEDLDLVRLEGDKVGDTCNLGPRLRAVPGPICPDFIKAWRE
jgi:hypothetical protein